MPSKPASKRPPRRKTSRSVSIRTRKGVLDQKLKLIQLQLARVRKGSEYELETGTVLDRKLSDEIRRADRMLVSLDGMLAAGKNQPERKRSRRRGGGAVTRLFAAAGIEPHWEEDDIEEEPEE